MISVLQFYMAHTLPHPIDEISFDNWLYSFVSVVSRCAADSMCCFIEKVTIEGDEKKNCSLELCRGVFLLIFFVLNCAEREKI